MNTCVVWYCCCCFCCCCCCCFCCCFLLLLLLFFRGRFVSPKVENLPIMSFEQLFLERGPMNGRNSQTLPNSVLLSPFMTEHWTRPPHRKLLMYTEDETRFLRIVWKKWSYKFWSPWINWIVKQVNILTFFFSSLLEATLVVLPYCSDKVSQNL